MKNVNVSVVFCDGDLSELGGAVKLGKFIDEIKVTTESNGSYRIANDLTVVTIVSAISGSNDDDLQKEYDILWTFEPVDADDSKRLQIAKSVLDVKKNKINKNSTNICRSFSNQIFKCTLRDLEISEVDKPYLLKIFMREKSESKWQIQAMNSIQVINSFD